MHKSCIYITRSSKYWMPGIVDGRQRIALAEGYAAGRIACATTAENRERGRGTSVFRGVMTAVGLGKLLAKKRDEHGRGAR